MLLNKNTRKKMSYVMLPVMILYTILPTTAYGAEAYTQAPEKTYRSETGSPDAYGSAKEAAEALNKEVLKGTVQSSGSTEDKSSSTSAASNYTMGVGAEVNVQTGQLDITFNDIKLDGMSEDVGIDLGISYAGSTQSIYGMPQGWKLSLDYIDTQANKLYMDGSQNYAIDSNFYSYDSSNSKYYSGLRYCTTKGIKLERKETDTVLPYDSGISYRYILSTSKGSSEYFDYYGKLVCQDDRFGNRVIYNYDNKKGTVYNAKLVSINDSFNQNITISNSRNIITVTMPDNRTVVYDFSASDKISVKGASGRQATLTLGANNQVSKITYPTGGYIEYIYANNAIPYTSNGVTGYFSGIKEVIQHPDSKMAIRTAYNYQANPGYSFAGTGLCNYASDKDALMQSNTNSYKYATQITFYRSADCGGDIESVQTFNFLHLPLTASIKSNGSVLTEIKTEYHGQNKDSGDFPAFNQLKANYNLPSKVTSTTQERVHLVETEYDDYARKVSEKNYSDGRMTSETQTSYGSYDLATSQSVSDKIDNTKTIATNTLSADGKYIASSIAAIESNSSSAKVTTITADRHGRITSSTLSNELESSETATSYKQDGSTLTVTTTDALGNTTSKSTDTRNGNILSETDAEGNCVNYTYDASGLVVTKTYPDGSWEKSDSSDANKTVTSSSKGIIKTSILDGFGRVIEESDNFGRKNTTQYNELGSPSIETDMFGRSIKHTYDYQGRELSQTDYLGNAKTTIYDDGKQTSTEYINGIKAVVSQYDDNGNVKSQQSFLSTLNSYASSTYNGKNLEIKSSLSIEGKENIISSSSSYNIDDKLVKAQLSTADGTSWTSEYVLNLFGDVISKNTTFSSVSPGVDKSYKDQIITSEKKVYNKIGLLVSLVNQEGQTITYTYDANGNIETMTDFSGNIFEYTYDSMNRMLTMEGPEYTLSNEYYEVGEAGAEGELKSRNLLNAKDGTVIDTISYAYDAQGRPTKVTYNNGKSMSMSYDKYDRVISMTDFAGSVNTYTYDSMVPDNITSVSNKFGSASYSYYTMADNVMFGDGKTVSKVTYSNGITINYKYTTSKNKSPILKSIETRNSKNVLISGFSYTYDELDRVSILEQQSDTAAKDSNCNNTRCFTYNDMNQLISEEVTDNNEDKVTSASYIFDINGNIIRRIIIDKNNKVRESNEYLYNSINQLVRITDKNGGIKDFKYDANGNMTDIISDDTILKHFTYNSINQLVEYSDSDGTDVCYEYNAESLRKCKYFKGHSSERINYYYSQDASIINEESNNGLMTSYLMAGGRALRAVGDQVEWYIMNGKDVVSTVDNSQKTTNVYNYNAYGEDVDLNTNPPTLELSDFRTLEFDLKSNPYKYSSYYLDEESGMYYLQARYYSPELMRFISRDTYDLSNRYAYGDGDPISNVDPNGHKAFAILGAAISGIGILIGHGMSQSNNSSVKEAGMIIGGIASILFRASLIGGRQEEEANLLTLQGDLHQKAISKAKVESVRLRDNDNENEKRTFTKRKLSQEEEKANIKKKTEDLKKQNSEDQADRESKSTRGHQEGGRYRGSLVEAFTMREMEYSRRKDRLYQKKMIENTFKNRSKDSTKTWNYNEINEKFNNEMNQEQEKTPSVKKKKQVSFSATVEEIYL